MSPNGRHTGPIAARSLGTVPRAHRGRKNTPVHAKNLTCCSLRAPPGVSGEPHRGEPTRRCPSAWRPPPPDRARPSHRARLGVDIPKCPERARRDEPPRARPSATQHARLSRRGPFEHPRFGRPRSARDARPQTPCEADNSSTVCARGAAFDMRLESCNDFDFIRLIRGRPRGLAHFVLGTASLCWLGGCRRPVAGIGI